MKNNKVLKFGIALISTVVLGAVAPVLTDAPIFGATVVKAEERGSLNYRISYYDGETGEEIAAKKTGVINPGETVNVHKDIDGYEVTSKDSWMPNYEATYDMVAKNFHGDPDGYKGFHLDYKKLNPTPTPDPVPTPTPDPVPTPTPDPVPTPTPDPVPTPTPDPVPTPTPDPVPTPTPDPVPTPTPGKDQKDPAKPDKPQLPETGEKDSAAATLLGLLTAALAWFTLRKKKNY